MYVITTYNYIYEIVGLLIYKYRYKYRKAKND